MAYIVRMPKLGLEMKQGTVLEWQVDAEGEVAADEPLVEIESEKTTSTVEAREDGTLREVLVEAGEAVPPGTPLGIVAAADADVADLRSEAEGELADAGVEGAEPAAEEATAEPSAGDATAEPAAEPAESTPGAGAAEPERVSPRAEQKAEELGVALAGIDGTGPGGAVTTEDVERAAEAGEATPAGGAEDRQVSPRAEQKAEELGVALAGVEGSGPGGAVTAEDVERAAEAGTAAEAPAPAGGATRTVRDRETFSGMRSTIARRLGESYREAVHVTVHRTADAAALREATAAAEEALDTDLAMTDLLLAALSETLAEYPSFNATYEDGEHVRYEEHNVNVAVDVEEGLVTPVVAGVDEKSIAEISRERRRVTELTLSGDYTMDDLSGGTFTVSNLGPLGVEAFDPIINPPQIAILGVNALTERVEMADGEAVARPVLPLDLSFDHRVVDGADAARFMDALVERVEHPWPLLVGAGGKAEASAEGTDAGTGGEPAAARAAGDGSGAAATRFADVARRTHTGNLTGTEGTFTLADYDHEYPFGVEEAPTPPEIFLGSLASCLGLTLRNVALPQGVELGAVDVDGAMHPEGGSVESIELVVAVDAPDVDDDRLAELLEEAEDECHVANVVREDLPVDVSLVRA